MVKFLRRKLSNGITLIVEQRDLPVVSLGIANPFGASFEASDVKGVAHFIEHLLFTGTKTRTHEDISREIEKKGGQKTMSTYMKKLAGLLFTGLPAKMFVAGMMAAGMLVLNSANVFAYSDTISSNNATAMVVRITPNADRGVQISTGNVNLNMGNVDLGVSTQTVNPATVTITGNMIETELDLSGSITGGWSFDSNQTLASTGTNLLNVWATFTSISSATAPSQDDEYFHVGTASGAKLVSTTNSFPATAVGISGGSGVGFFENYEGGTGLNGADMDSMSPGSRRHLWTYFRLPPTTSITGAQDINFVLSIRQGP